VALALLAAGSTHLGAQGTGTTSASCADSIPATALRPGVAYLTSTYADSAVPAHRTTMSSIDVLTQSLASRVRELLGAAPKVLPAAEPALSWKDLDLKLTVLVRPRQPLAWRIAGDTSDTFVTGRGGVALLARALDSLAAHGQAFVQPDSTLTDSTSFSLQFLVVSDSARLLPTTMRLGFPVFTVMSPVGTPVSLTAGAPVRYPARWRSAGYQAEVVMLYVVDREGRVRPESMRDVIPPTTRRPEGRAAEIYADFVSEVKRVLPQMRFAPARIGGCPAAQLVQQPFTFALRD
jgi:hypothetical protein